MNTIRSFCTVLLTTVALMVMPLSATEQMELAHQQLVFLPFSTSIEESVTLQTLVPNTPPPEFLDKAPDTQVIVTHVVRKIDGTEVGKVSTMVPAGGIAEVTFTPELHASGEVVLQGKTHAGEYVVIGIVDTGLDIERVSYVVMVIVNTIKSRAGSLLLFDETAPIPPNVEVSTTSRIFNTDTGATKAEGTIKRLTDKGFGFIE